jgi:MFS family permease
MIQVFIAAEYYMPLYFQSVLEASALRSGVLLLPLIVAAASSGVFAGLIIHRTGKFREIIWAGTVFTCLAFGLFILFDVSTSIATLVVVQILCGLGYGVLFEAPLIAIQSQVEQQDVATATSTLTFVRCMALSISTIVGGVIFQNSMENRASFLRAAGLPREVLQKLDGGNAMANVMLPSTLGNPDWELAAKQAFAWSMRNMWIVYTGVAFLAVIAGLFVEAAHLGTEHTETVTGLKNEKRRAPTVK